MRSKKNITSNSRNITSHFTGKLKIITLVSTIIMLSFTNITFTSALSYQSSVGVGFTFNPTLSVNISPSDLVISNLTPGTTGNSNIINVSVATNAAHGYTLSATMNGNNSDLTHTSNSVNNNKNIFSSIATNADLSSLDNIEDSNIWGYSYKDNTVEMPAWSNYNGLSSSNSTTLINTNSNVSSNLDFKIAAKASSIQPSGTYTSTINFTAVSNVAPMSLLDSFIASGAEQLNGYFRMQDMTHSICSNVDIEESELQLIDVRDDKIYWVAKLKDGNCWMTQNLDLDLSHEVALTSETSDIDPTTYGTGIYTNETGYSKNSETNIVSWTPSTIDSGGAQRADTIDMVWSSNTVAAVPGWTNDNNKPYSANAGNRYRYANSSSNEAVYTSYNACLAGTNDDKAGCQHSHFGNYYNWPAAAATNDASAASERPTWGNSICPKNWDLPANGEYGTLMQEQNVWSGGSSNTYVDDGFNKLRTAPLYFQRFGLVDVDSLTLLGSYGYYWSSSIRDNNTSYRLNFNDSNIWPNVYSSYRNRGASVRCIAQ